ncbi:MAG: DUF2470 domain-containing protein [Gammaproteobacteria bacterium]
MSGPEAAAAARALIAGCYDGVLATLSVDCAGYPFGSVVPYCLDRQARPVILIASIAQHTRNIRVDARVSLTMFVRDAADLQAAGRVTYIGDAEPLPPGPAHDDAAARYLRYFPEAAAYDRTHDFAFYAITPKRLRFIGGFGAIHWLTPETALVPNPFEATAERGIVEHMNADHADAIRHYCAQAGIVVAAGVDPVLVGCDGEGIDIRVGERVRRVPFAAPVGDLAAVRATLVAMARRPAVDA